MWAGTNKGLRPVELAQPWGAGPEPRLETAPEVVDGTLRDLTRDGFGRVWALTSNAIALLTPAKVNANRGP